MAVKMNMAVMLVILLLAGLMVSGGAQALGVTPGRHTLYFEPGTEHSLEFTIINNEHKDFNAIVYVQGELGEYVTPEKSLVEFTESTNSMQMKYTVRFPQEIENPGDNWAEIVVKEMPSGMDEVGQESVVIATIAIAHQLKVKVPYKGKYAEAELSVVERDSGEGVDFFVKVLNLGEEDLSNVEASIDVLGANNVKIITLENGKIDIKSKGIGELLIPWDTRVNPGMYHASAVVRYEGKIARAEKNFGIGNKMVDVRGVSVKDFQLGGIAKFDIEVENKWNERIEGVYTRMLVKDGEGNTIGDFKSASDDIEPLGRLTLYAYWDTEGVKKGTYEADLEIHYGDKTTEKSMTVDVGFNGIETRVYGLTGRAVGPPLAGSSEMSSYIILLILVLVGINLGWFFRFRRKFK